MPDRETKISGRLRLRPLRIGFLVRPTDIKNVRRIMRLCSCIWGGMYNPIIPVFDRTPLDWRRERLRCKNPLDVAAGYVTFFEPDVYVEAEEGLAAQIGLKGLRNDLALEPSLINIDDFLAKRLNSDVAEPAFGVNIYSVLRKTFKTEHRFQKRRPTEAFLFSHGKATARDEAVFGVYPDDPSTSYFQSNFAEVFDVTPTNATAAHWIKVFKEGAETPLRITKHGLDAERYWRHEPVVFVFDPTKPTDLIDLWNMRCEPEPLFPVPVEWFEELSDPIADLLKSSHRPIIGNPNGVMHRETIEFSRSTPRETADRLIQQLPKLPDGSLSVKHWRNPIWDERRFEGVRRNTRLKITAAEKSVDLIVNSDRTIRGRFATIAPDFIESQHQLHAGWVNCLTLYSHGDEFATELPFNTFDRSWPTKSRIEQYVIGSEGWVFPQRDGGLDQSFAMENTADMLASYLRQFGLTGQL